MTPEQLRQFDQQLNAFTTVFDAPEVSAATGLLAGMVMGIKDVLVTKGTRSTGAAKVLDQYKGVYDATAVAKVRAAGATIVGKLNCDAFAHGASGENSDYGATKNPWDTTRVAGGSSSGPAAAVASGMVQAALATDTGGSIRVPAAFCGVVGLKPTYGRVSRYGLMAMTSSNDVVGPITRTVTDAAKVLQVIAGEDDHDATTASVPVPSYTDTFNKGIKGLRIGVPREYFDEGLHAGVERAVKQALEVLRKLGAEIVAVSLPTTPWTVPTYYIITPSEVSANLAKYDGVRFGYSAQTDADAPKPTDITDFYKITRGRALGAEAKRRIMMGTFALSSGYKDAFYKKAAQVRTLIARDFEAVFREVDVLITPTHPSFAFPIGAQVNDPLKMYLEDVYVAGASLAGLPAISVPCGFVEPEHGAPKLPVGMQIIGRHFEEETMLRVAYAYEQETQWVVKHKPKVFVE